MARLLSRQKPRLPCGSLAQVTTPTGPAWCPGGRTAQNAFRAWRAQPRERATMGARGGARRRACGAKWASIM